MSETNMDKFNREWSAVLDELIAKGQRNVAQNVEEWAGKLLRSIAQDELKPLADKFTGEGGIEARVDVLDAIQNQHADRIRAIEKRLEPEAWHGREDEGFARWGDCTIAFDASVPGEPVCVLLSIVKGGVIEVVAESHGATLEAAWRGFGARSATAKQNTAQRDAESGLAAPRASKEATAEEGDGGAPRHGISSPGGMPLSQPGTSPAVAAARTWTFEQRQAARSVIGAFTDDFDNAEDNSPAMHVVCAALAKHAHLFAAPGVSEKPVAVPDEDALAKIMYEASGDKYPGCGWWCREARAAIAEFRRVNEGRGAAAQAGAEITDADLWQCIAGQLGERKAFTFRGGLVIDCLTTYDRDLLKRAAAALNQRRERRGKE